MSLHDDFVFILGQIEWADKQKPPEYDIRTTLVYKALVLARALEYPAGIRVDKEALEWPVVVIDLPGQGEVAWHCKGYNKAWDGHTDEEKYKRIQAYSGKK